MTAAPITVVYARRAAHRFISAWSRDSQLFGPLSRYAEVTVRDIPPSQTIDAALRGVRCDYLYLDIDGYGLSPLLWRQMSAVRLAFIIPAHTVYYRLKDFIVAGPLVRPCDLLVAPSAYAAGCLKMISQRWQVQVIPPCLDVAGIRAVPAAERFTDGTFSLIYLGRLAPEKNLETILEALAHPVLRNRRIMLHLIGPLSGETIDDQPVCGYVNYLKRKASRLGLGKRVLFHGCRLGRDKYELLRAGDVFVYPSLAPGETFGLSCLEAMACGMPVVTSRWAGLAELVSDGKNGFLLDVKADRRGDPHIDPAALAAKISLLMGKPRQLNAFRRAAQARAWDFDQERIMPIWAAALKKKRARSRSAALVRGAAATPLSFRRFYRPQVMALSAAMGWLNLSYSSLNRALNMQAMRGGKTGSGKAIRKQREGLQDRLKTALQACFTGSAMKTRRCRGREVS